jgi:hypothetical protein
VKTRAAASTHKKVIVTFSDHTTLQGYLNPLRLPDDPLDVLTTNGEHREVPLKEIRAVYFVRDFTDDYEPQGVLQPAEARRPVGAAEVSR